MFVLFPSFVICPFVLFNLALMPCVFIKVMVVRFCFLHFMSVSFTHTLSSSRSLSLSMGFVLCTNVNCRIRSRAPFDRIPERIGYLFGTRRCGARMSLSMD